VTAGLDSSAVRLPAGSRPRVVEVSCTRACARQPAPFQLLAAEQHHVLICSPVGAAGGAIGTGGSGGPASRRAGRARDYTQERRRTPARPDTGADARARARGAAAGERPRSHTAGPGTGCGDSTELAAPPARVRECKQQSVPDTAPAESTFQAGPAPACRPELLAAEFATLNSWHLSSPLTM
jgi:hypothetical protein